MSFDRISFEHLFHDGFSLDGRRLLAHLMLRNEVRRHAESALLAELVQRHHGEDLAAPSVEECEQRFDRMRARLDYPEQERTMEMLQSLGVSVDELQAELEAQLAVEKWIDQQIAALHADPVRRAKLFWRAFLTMSLMGDAVKACAVERLAAQATGGVDRDSQVRIRDHLQLLHDAGSWAEVERRLVDEWGMPRETLTQLLEVFARAAGQLR